MNRIIIILVFIMAYAQSINAQQDAQYTQYMYNTISINPAYAGSRGVFSITALHRSQWIGLDGAPTSQTFSFSTPVSKKVGIGLSIVNDEIGNGTNQDTYFNASFSYTVPTSETGKLSFGLNAGGHLLNLDFNKLRNFDPSISPGTTNIDQKFSPNFGGGIYYRTNKFYLGLSVPSFMETEHFDGSGQTSSYLAQERMNWYMISGYVFELNPNLKFKPALLFKAVKGAPLQADLSASFLFNDMFSLGAAYRWDAALSALLGFQITDQLMLGLAYDKETTELGSTQFNDGSFEAFLRYEFQTKRKKILTPRFF
ncbi:type IX secretion system PorP/SprF family membrane protein [Saonia flava]|uniref:Type IX secretion system PorP/SprF family membrane protein n=1 Tax=Saonia flava TaxID=523696 RepID=A0A846QZU8_9FLAO|nr:type IX secretion system membrane protein PorP/SprF [Saonia flava]NJB72440.1 type IX secretion system PorP/SprF family membrane protein [Saonia flava]